MAEQAGRRSAPPKRRDPAPGHSVQRHAMLERRAAAQPAAAYGAMLNARPAGPQPIQRAPNRSGLPDRLKSGVEALSGVSMDGVKVHYNSSMPAQLNAHAYAQGSDIHLAPGQERHLPHEAWHLVQQAQGRVKPTMQMKKGVAVNDDAGLEREADVMGAKAMRPGTPINGGPPALDTRVRRGSSVLQPFWELGPDGKVVWKDGSVPKGHIDTGRKKPPSGAPIYAAPEALKESKKEEVRAEEAEIAPYRQEALARAIPERSRSKFSDKERRRLAALPKKLVREDDDLQAETGKTGRRKAHLIDRGLATAGRAPITATEQMDQESVRKGRGNRISSKAPVVGQDRSQNYGAQEIGIKAQKLERARLRGKDDAQHVKVHTPSEIQEELDAGPEQSDTGKPKGVLKGFARKDREYHHEVGFFSPEDRRNYIPNRFLVTPGRDEIHDSDSESESEDEGVGSSSLPPGSLPWLWDEEYGMTRSNVRESDDMDDPLGE